MSKPKGAYELLSYIIERDYENNIKELLKKDTRWG